MITLLHMPFLVDAIEDPHGCMKLATQCPGSFSSTSTVILGRSDQRYPRYASAQVTVK